MPERRRRGRGVDDRLSRLWTGRHPDTKVPRVLSVIVKLARAGWCKWTGLVARAMVGADFDLGPFYAWAEHDEVLRTLVQRWNVDPGFNPGNVLTFGFSLSPSTLQTTPAAIRESFRAADSAVASTSRVLPVPVGPRNSKLPIGRPGLLMPARYVW